MLRFRILIASVFALSMLVFSHSVDAKDQPGLQHSDHKDGPGKIVINGMPMQLIPQASHCSPPMRALAVLTTPTHSNVHGIILFTQNDAPDGRVTVTGNITGLSPNSAHAFDIHQSGDLSNGCISAGDHFNPICAAGRNDHQDDMEAMEIGNLGDVSSNRDGSVTLNLTNARISLSGQNSVIGRIVIVHETIHDMATGEAGRRLACGVIGLVMSD